MHTLTTNNGWEIDFIRDDSDITPDGVTPQDLAGCCDIHYRRQDDSYNAEVEITEKIHNLELIVTASVFEIITETSDQSAESAELTPIYNVKRVFRQEDCLRLYQQDCKTKAFQYADELTKKIDRRYFSINNLNQDDNNRPNNNNNQLELPLTFS